MYVCNNVQTPPFWEFVVVVALDGGIGLLETDVVKPGKGGSVDVRDPMVRDKKQLL